MKSNGVNIFISNNSNSKNNDINNHKSLENQEDEQQSLKDERTSYKLTLRKQKLKVKLYNKRIFQANNKFIKIGCENIEIKRYTKEDLANGKIYADIKNAYNENNIIELKQNLLGLSFFLENISVDNGELLNYLKNSNTDGGENFPIGILLYEIMLHINDKLIFINSINILLNCSFISDDFCSLLTTKEKISEILKRLIYFYPLFIEGKKLNENNNTDKEENKIESYFTGNQVLKLLGNLIINAKTYEAFESNNLYNKIFYLLSIFDLNFENRKNIKHAYEYLETLLWLVHLLFDKIENIKLNYFDKIINIIPNLLNSIRALYFTQETELLEYIIYILGEIQNSSNTISSKEIIENDGLKILSNLFGYLFNADKNSFEIEINPRITLSILSIFTDIFFLETKDIINYDLSQFILVFEKLFDIYKMHHSNHYDIQDVLLQLLSNLACFCDVGEIVIKIFFNNKMMNNLFVYYYNYHKSRTMQILDNIIVKQHKKIKDFILDIGGFNVIKNSIVNYDSECMENIMEEGLVALYHLINSEKQFNIRLLFEKLYRTAIPEKIKEIELNIDLHTEIDTKVKMIILDFETYEKSLENEI